MCDSQCEVGVGGIPGEVFHSHKHTDLFVGVPIQPPTDLLQSHFLRYMHLNGRAGTQLSQTRSGSTIRGPPEFIIELSGTRVSREPSSQNILLSPG